MTRWLAADWGTSWLRIWALDGSGAVTGTARSADGMGKLAPAEFEPAFLRVAAGLLSPEERTPVLICGMAGARSGWREVSYAAVPCAPGAPPEAVQATDPRLSVRILPGLSQTEPPDVMRGEETQIAGLVARMPGFDGVVCLPGTHTKWARVAEGRVTGFRTAMTGELFDLLATRSTLAAFTAEGWEEDAFEAGLDNAFAAPAALTSHLFALRAAGLLTRQSSGAGRARLSGLLIGSEVLAMRGHWGGQPAMVVGDPALTALYTRAITKAGTRCSTLDAAALTLDGLRAAQARYLEDSA